MNAPTPRSGEWHRTTVRNTVRLGYWTLAWLLSMALAVFGPNFLWEGNDALSWLAILVNLAIGFGMIAANKRHLKGLDELHQKVQLEAMAIALGVTLVVGLAYSNLDIANLIAFDAEIGHVVMVTSATYGLGVFVGLRKYR